MRFTPGTVLTVREMWWGQTWLHFPEVVVADGAGATGDVLATMKVEGTPLTFPEHPGGPHPWSSQTHWRGATVLKLRRTGQWYSVWRFFDTDGTFTHWYVNFERPVVRRADGIDVDDLELDLVVHPDGRRDWKDVECLSARLTEGRFTVADLQRVLAATPEVIDRLDRDDRWWSDWDTWTPADAPVES